MVLFALRSAVFDDNVLAVSYTHLAVYKRQLKCGTSECNLFASSYFHAPTIGNLLYSKLDESLDFAPGNYPSFPSDHIGPVSYTHLDVYKRQPD